MTIVNVAIPVLKGRTIFVFDKGRPWSLVEHLLLQALARKESTASDLAAAGNLPRRIVVESCIRLMRAGWVELSHDAKLITFKANDQGIIASKCTELPSVLERKRRPINYIVDLVNRDVFRNHEWSTRPEHEIRDRSKREPFIWLEPASMEANVDGTKLIDTLLGEDETFVHAESFGLSRRYVVVTVKDGIIEGLPDGRNLDELRSAIKEAASQSPAPTKDSPTKYSLPKIPEWREKEIPEQRKIYINNKDLILDGPAHKNFLKKIISDAKSKILIHSTFIDHDKFLEFLPDFLNAALRGVRIHIFWGQNEEGSQINSTQAAISRLRKNPDIISISDQLVFHPFSTNSHAKLIVADAGENDQYVAVVGSCNWLTSNFSSYEASVTLRDPTIVKDVVRYFSKLSCIHDGVWSDIASELIFISQQISSSPTTLPANALGTIIIGAQHGHVVLHARDNANIKALVTSHRLGAVSDPAVIVPLMKAAKEKNIEVKILYGRTVKPIKPANERALIQNAAEDGVCVKAIETPRLHAKILAWDTDSIVLTSLNWLSADPSDLHSLNEIGVWIESKDLATELFNNLKTISIQ